MAKALHLHSLEAYEICFRVVCDTLYPPIRHQFQPSSSSRIRTAPLSLIENITVHFDDFLHLVRLSPRDPSGEGSVYMVRQGSAVAYGGHCDMFVGHIFPSKSLAALKRPRLSGGSEDRLRKVWSCHCSFNRIRLTDTLTI